MCNHRGPWGGEEAGKTFEDAGLVACRGKTGQAARKNRPRPKLEKGRETSSHQAPPRQAREA